MRVRITKTPAIDPAHGVVRGQEYTAHFVPNMGATIQVQSRETGKKIYIEPGEWEPVEPEGE